MLGDTSWWLLADLLELSQGGEMGLALADRKLLACQLHLDLPDGLVKIGVGESGGGGFGVVCHCVLRGLKFFWWRRCCRWM